MIYPLLIYRDESGKESAAYKICPEGFNLLDFKADNLIRLTVYRARKDAETIAQEINKENCKKEIHTTTI